MERPRVLGWAEHLSKKVSSQMVNEVADRCDV